MTTLNIRERQVSEVIILDMEGSVRIGDGSISFRKAIRQLLLEEKRWILLNLEGVTYIDSSGLGELISGYTAIKKSRGELKLLHLTEKIRDLMTITKLLTVFDVYENEREAVDSFRGSTSEFEDARPPKIREVQQQTDKSDLWPRGSNLSKLQ
jgi:anti-sigma B factor antagonist